MKIAYSGIEGAFAYIAAKRIFPNAELVAFADFHSAYEAVEKDEIYDENREIVSQNSYTSFRNSRNYRNIPKIEENRIQRETRQRNFLLNDLIRILVLRELIGSGRRLPRPNPPRPPMPPRPGEFPPPPPRPGARPPRF